MAKKLLLVSALAALVAGGAFAEVKLSAGAGYLNTGTYAGAMTEKGSAHTTTYTYAGQSQGGSFFFDATYAELSLGLMYGWGGFNSRTTWKDKRPDSVAGAVSKNLLSLDIGLLGKYPLPLGNITVSPLLGVGYNLALHAKPKGGEKIKWGKENTPDGVGDYGVFRIQLGAGADFDVTDRIFVRNQGLVHFNFAPQAVGQVAERRNKDPKDNGKWSKTQAGGYGAMFVFSVGYRF